MRNTTSTKTDAEKIQFVKDLIERACQAAWEESDKIFDKLEKEWLDEHMVTSQDICSRCGESTQLAKIKGCIRCLVCGWKEDCNGF